MTDVIEYFVSDDGDDDNPGTRERPFKTWDRLLRAMGRFPADDTIRIVED